MSIMESDVKRATAILNTGMKHKMVPDGAIPESDENKIIEAEKLVALAKQAKVVADQIGHGNVPNFQAVVDILFEAEVTVGTANGQAAPDAPPTPVGTMTIVAKSETNELLFTHDGCDGKSFTFMAPLDDIDPSLYENTMVECANCALQVPVTSIVHELDPALIAETEAALWALDNHRVKAEPEPVAQAICGVADNHRVDVACEREAGHPGSHLGGVQTWDSFLDPATAPKPEPEAEPEPDQREAWLDANGTKWFIIREGGAQVEACAEGSDEPTVLPREFLIQRVSQEPTSSPSPSPEPPPPSASPPATSAPEVSGPAQSQASGTESPAPPLASSPPSASSSSPTSEPAPVDDDQGDPEYANVLERAEGNYQPQAMPVPMDLETPPPGIPDDLTQVGVEENRRLHSQFNALSARARYLKGLEAAKARDCERVRKGYMKIAMREARTSLGKDASVTEVTQLAEDAESVRAWSARVQHHGDRAEAYKTFLEIYSENVSVLSRDYTMRDLEERSS